MFIKSNVRTFLAEFTLILACIEQAPAGQATIAVAANFTEPAREIAARFEDETGHDLTLSFGSTGQLYNQIMQGAPFDAFLAADAERPARSIEEGLGVPGSLFTYAIGTIVLYSPDADLVKDRKTLGDADFEKIAIANPLTAPYGAASVEVMQRLGVLEDLEPKLVRGNNIAQAFQFVETGNAELGFMAASQVIDRAGSKWFVPPELYEPIRQDAVLLETGANNEAAKAFLSYLKCGAVRSIVGLYGYETATGPEPAQ